MSNGVAAVLGVGPGLGAAVARRFAREGFAVALMARSEESVAGAREEIEGKGGTALPVATDATDPASVQAAFERVREELGDPEVFVYNAGAFQMGGILEVSPREVRRVLQGQLRRSVFNAIHKRMLLARSLGRAESVGDSDAGAGVSFAVAARDDPLDEEPDELAAHLVRLPRCPPRSHRCAP